MSISMPMPIRRDDVIEFPLRLSFQSEYFYFCLFFFFFDVSSPNHLILSALSQHLSMQKRCVFFSYINTKTVLVAQWMVEYSSTKPPHSLHLFIYYLSHFVTFRYSCIFFFLLHCSAVVLLVAHTHIHLLTARTFSRFAITSYLPRWFCLAAFFSSLLLLVLLDVRASEFTK